MKLYLSSYQLGREPQRLTDLVGENKRTAVISNALDFSDELERKRTSIQREIDDLTALGLQAEELDLRAYFGHQDALDEQMTNFGLIWAIGGNSFVLRRALKQSGLDEIIERYRTDRGHSFVYAGYSAGAVVATQTLRGIELVDEPDVVPAKYEPGVIWEGMGLVSYSIAPHYRSNHPESDAIENVVRYFEENDMPFKALSDGEVIVAQL